MSKRCELQKEYYKEYGNYKGEGKYDNHYVHWLENKVLALTLTGVVVSEAELKVDDDDDDWVQDVIDIETMSAEWRKENL